MPINEAAHVRSRAHVLGALIGAPVGCLVLLAFCLISFKMVEGSLLIHTLNFIGLIFSLGGLVFCAFMGIEFYNLGSEDRWLVFSSEELEERIEHLAHSEPTHAEVKSLLEAAKAAVARQRGRRYNPLQMFMTSHVAHIQRDMLGLLARIEREAKLRDAARAKQEGEPDASDLSVGYRGATSLDAQPGDSELLSAVRGQIEKAQSLHDAMNAVNQFEQQLEQNAALDANARGSLLKQIKDEMYGRYYEK